MNPWIILGIVALWIASLAAVGLKANEIGHETEKAAWLAKENVTLRTTAIKFKAMNDDARAKEQAHVNAMAALGADYETKLAAANARRKRDQAAIRAGDLQLRIATSRICPGGSAAAEAGPTPGERDGPASVGLPQQITSDLYDLANDADAVTDQLRACQAVILSDRKEGP